MKKLLLALIAPLICSAQWNPIVSTKSMDIYRSITSIETLRNIGVPVSGNRDTVWIRVETKDQDATALRITVRYREGDKLHTVSGVDLVTKSTMQPRGSGSYVFLIPNAAESIKEITVEQLSASDTASWPPKD